MELNHLIAIAFTASRYRLYIRYMPIEIFNVMYVFIKENCLQQNEKKTQSTITVCLLSQEDLRVLFNEGRRLKKTKKASWESSCEDLLLQDLGRKGHTELHCGPNNPFKVRFSHSKQCVFMECNSGY